MVTTRNSTHGEVSPARRRSLAPGVNGLDLDPYTRFLYTPHTVSCLIAGEPRGGGWVCGGGRGPPPAQMQCQALVLTHSVVWGTWVCMEGKGVRLSAGCAVMPARGLHADRIGPLCVPRC